MPGADRVTARGLVAVCRMGIEGSQELIDEIEELIPLARAAPSQVLVDLLLALFDPFTDRDPERARTLARDAVAVARELGEPETIARALVHAHMVPWALGDFEEHRRVLAEADAYMRASGARGAASECLGWLAINAQWSGDFEAAAGYVEGLERLARASGSPAQLGLVLQIRSVMALARGDIDSARTAAEASLAAHRDSGVQLEIGIAPWFIAEALAAAGELTAAIAALRTSIDDLAAPALQGYRAETRARLALLLLEAGDVAGARREAMLARAEVAPRDAFTVASSTASVAAVHAAEGDHESADRLYREALEAWGRTGYAYELACLRRDYAAFLVDRGRVAEARLLLERVLAFFVSPLVARERALTEDVLRRCAETGASA